MSASAAEATPNLLEREAELDAMDESIERARAGQGSVVLVEGPPGIGKTKLLEAARERAGKDGFTSLDARGSELEDEFAFGIARQLFERPLAEMDDGEREQALSGAAGLASGLFELDLGVRPPTPSGEIFPLLHGLHWLCANLASDEPLLIAVDDAHWADQPSLRFLHYLAGRIEELPVLVAAGARSTAPEAPVELIEAMRVAPAVNAISPTPLSEAGAEDLLATLLSERPERGFARAVWRASGGNPFLLTELARALADEGVTPDDGSIERVDAIGPDAIANSVLTRVARMPGETATVARSIAVLGDGADLRAAAALSDLPTDAVEQAADTLVDGGVLEEGAPLRFTHPLVRAAIYEDVPSNERARMHTRGATVLDSLGAPAEASAGHLLRAHPGGDAGRLPLLRRAAESALSRGAPAAAADYLRRALDEGPIGPDRLALLARLGRAEVQADDPEGIEHLNRAVELSTDPRERADLIRFLALGLAQAGRLREATEALTRELQAAGDAPREVRLDLECDLAATMLLTLDTDPAALDGLLTGAPEDDATTLPAERGLLAARACRLAQRGLDGDAAAVAATRAWHEGVLDDFPAGSPQYVTELYALVACDELDAARRLAAEGLSRAHASAVPLGITQSTHFLSVIAFREGSLTEAESYANEALEIVRVHESCANGLASSVAVLINLMIERGQTEPAWAELERAGLAGEPPPITTTAELLESRGRLRAARGDLSGGRVDLLAARAWFERWGVTGPGLTSWRSHAALVQLQLGDGDEAHRLATEDLELARRFGAPRPIGIALRTLGLIDGGEQGIALLAEAGQVLVESSDRLEHGRALVDFGAALRRANRRAEARERLREGLELASRCGATVLAGRAREELQATGARPRKPYYSGVESLTPAELRTARMAAEAMTNREIAQALFVTQKTVETHLRNAYRKLEISGRSGLEEALDNGVEAAP